jgi:hypothetical protein
MDGEAISLRHIDSNEINAGLHETTDKGNVAGQTIQLRNDQGGSMKLTGGQGPPKLGTVTAFAALYLCELGYQITAYVIRDCDSLCLKTKTRPTLLVGADSKIANELLIRHGSLQALSL